MQHGSEISGLCHAPLFYLEEKTYLSSFELPPRISSKFCPAVEYTSPHRAYGRLGNRGQTTLLERIYFQPRNSALSTHQLAQETRLLRKSAK
jgi:hypothetical protein